MARQSRANPATLEGANSSPLVGRSGGVAKPASADGQGPLTLALRVRRGQDAYLALNLCSRRRERGLAAPPQRRRVGSAWLSHYSRCQFCLLASRGEGGSPQGGPAPLVPYAKWQAAKWPDFLASSLGLSSAQMPFWVAFSLASGQRVRKGQPDGGLNGLGTSPVSWVRLRRWSGSGCGMADISDLV